MTDLDKLIAAVGADATIAWGRGGSPSRKVLPMHWHDAMDAYLGSLDAALRLHEALLPGWTVDNMGQRAGGWLVQLGRIDGKTPRPAPEAMIRDNPARAWLLAILRALKAKGDA